MDEAIRNKVLTLLDQHRIMTIATLRPDGWPQATTVGYVNEGLTLYFLCGLESQKATNLARDDRVSLTIDHDTGKLMEITGLSMAAHAQTVTDRAEAAKVLRMLPLKYPEPQTIPIEMPTPDDVRIFRVVPTVISDNLTARVKPIDSHSRRRSSELALGRRYRLHGPTYSQKRRCQLALARPRSLCRPPEVPFLRAGDRKRTHA